MADEEKMTVNEQKKMQMYTSLGNFRNNEVTLRWQRSLLMIVLNTAYRGLAIFEHSKRNATSLQSA